MTYLRIAPVADCCSALFLCPPIRAPPVLNFNFTKIQNKEDLRNGRQLLHNHQR